MLNLHKGTLHESGSAHMREWSSRSCHMRLQLAQPPGTRVLQPEKWRTSSSSPLQAGKPHAAWLPLSILSRGPIVLHPSRHMCTKASIASCSCTYTFLSSAFFALSAFLCISSENEFVVVIETSRNPNTITRRIKKAMNSQNLSPQGTPEAPALNSG